jgi:hypothetical protein
MEINQNNIQKGTCICSICGQEKDNSHFSFYEDRITKRGEKAGFRLRVNTNCRECSKIRNKERTLLKKKYGHLKPKSGSLCPSCHKPTKKFELDHCHVTGIFRGYVCKDCNVGFGKLGDSPIGLINSLKYQLQSISDKTSRVNIIEELKQII